MIVAWSRTCRCRVCSVGRAQACHGRLVMSGMLPLASLWREELSAGVEEDPRLLSTDSQVALRNALNWAFSHSNSQVYLPFTIRPYRKASRSTVLLWAEALQTRTRSKGMLVGIEWGLTVGWHCHGILALRDRVERDEHRSHALYSVHFGKFSQFCRRSRVIRKGEASSIRFTRVRPDVRPWMRYCCKDGLVVIYPTRRMITGATHPRRQEYFSDLTEVTESDIIDMEHMRDAFTSDHVAHDCFDGST